MAREREGFDMIDFRTLGKCDQIAFYAHNEQQADAIKMMFGLLSAEWKQDEVAGQVTVARSAGGELINGLSRGLLQFNYDLGIELEILTYTSGPNWHDVNTPDFAGGLPFLSHIGFHLPDEGEMLNELGSDAPCVQEMFTLSHTNPYLIEKERRYQYRIFDTRPVNGVYTKLIRRIEPPKSGPVFSDEVLKAAGRITGADVLQEAADTFRERNKVYGDNYLRVGAVMAALFPNGLTVKTEHDWNRLHIFLLDIVKKTRYVQNWVDGHNDSVRDATVYSAMLESIDRNGA